jgi:flagellar basal body-associated protein FliL
VADDTAPAAEVAQRTQAAQETERTREQTAREQTEREREQTRRRIAYILIGALVVIVLGAFVYIIWMSLRFGELTTDVLISVLQTIGTTLLAPLIGLIGAVIGFYYGGQTAVQGAQTATQAASQGAQQTTQAATQAAAQTTRAVTQAASELASQVPTDQPGQRTTEQR